MKYTLKSIEWLDGVEVFNAGEPKRESEEKEELVDEPTDCNDGNEALALMLEWKMRLSEDSEKCTTCECDIDFSNRQALVEHYQSAWHKTNLKRKINNLEVLDEEEFENFDEKQDFEAPTQFPSNGSESDDEDIDVCLLPSGKSFFVHRNSVFSVSKSILHSDETSVCSSTFTRPFDCAIFLLNGGHFAAGIYKNDRLILHRSFHRYVARAKQGGVQSQYDNSHGNAKSAGAALRRYNEAKMKEEIQELLSSWKKQLSETPLIFLRCASYQKAIFLDSDSGMGRGDDRVRTIPFETKRANADEVANTWNRLQFVEEHGTVEKFREEMRELSERRKRVTQKVEKKRTRKNDRQIEDWDENGEKESLRKMRNDDGEEKKTNHIKIRPVEPKPDNKWPDLDDEWRKKAYNFVRTDDTEGLENHIKTINENLKEQVHDYFRNARFASNSSTFLHICAAKALLNVLKYLLNEINCDPTSKDENGKPPYPLSADKRVKDVFIQFRVENPEKFTWTRTHIPEPPKPVVLTLEEETKAAEKRKEKKQKQKEKLKLKKEEEKKEEDERKEKERWANLSERQKRAEAVERRLSGLPPISRCQQCGSTLPDIPFQYSHYKFCSTGCVTAHRKVNP